MQVTRKKPWSRRSESKAISCAYLHAPDAHLLGGSFKVIGPFATVHFVITPTYRQ
jgi:hypothetical protein